MKLKKIFAGMAASAIAMSTFAMTSTTASAEENPVYNAGIAFQTNTTWNYRDLFGTTGSRAVFPQAEASVQGGAYGVSTDIAISDTTIQYDGTYTVSIGTNGTITEEHPDKAGTADNGFYVNEEKTLTRQGSPWSMLCNYELPKSDDSEESSAELTQDDLAGLWEPTGAKTDKFNMLCISTDIPCEYNDEDKPLVNGKEVIAKDITVDMCGTTYTAEGDVYYKSDIDTFAIALINTYGDSTIDPAALPAADGTITVTFTIEGLGAAPSTESTESTESTSNSTTSSTKSNGGSASNKTNSTSKTTSTTSVASDKTENAEAGAPAGIALALAAVAGAAIVISRKK